jgi:hypothetical protein
MPHGADVAGPLSALAFALLASGHCVAMCGPIAAATALRARTPAHVFAQHAGRLLAYTSLGTAAGAAGGVLFDAHAFLGAGSLLRTATGALLALLGLRLLLGLGQWAWLERIAGSTWHAWLRPLSRHASRTSGLGGAILTGVLWGFLPCGLVWTALLGAAAVGSAAYGGLMLLAFGAGTLPAMGAGAWLLARTTGAGRGGGTASSTGASLLQRRAAWRAAAAGLLLVAAGTWTAAVPWMGGHAHH